MAKKKELIEENNAEVAASIDFNNSDDITPLDDDVIIANIDSEKSDDTKVVEEVKPKMEDYGWTNWVLSQFEPGELEEGRPKVHGLRRMTRKLIGPIIKSYPNTKQVPTIENEQRSTVEYTIVVLNKYNLEDDEQPYVLEFGDVADAYRGNINGLEFARFPPQMASTRAESRALRKLLCLDVVANEEVTDQPLEEAGFAREISENQITKIDIKCQQLNIDVMKFINIGRPKKDRPLLESIEDVTSVMGVKMFGELNLYQQYDPKVKNLGKPIPESIIGYKPNWRGDF